MLFVVFISFCLSIFPFWGSFAMDFELEDTSLLKHRPDIFKFKFKLNDHDCSTAYYDSNSKYSGFGGSKRVLKIGKERVALIPNEGVSQKQWKILIHKEKEAYDIFTQIGLFSQQDPKLVTLGFEDCEISDALSVVSFDHLVELDLGRMIYDSKNGTRKGNVYLFKKSRECFDNIRYKMGLVNKLIQDLALWYFIGSPGDRSESLNLIVFQSASSEAYIRLFLYDIHDKFVSPHTNLFKLQKGKKDSEDMDTKSLLTGVLETIMLAIPRDERKILWPNNDFNALGENGEWLENMHQEFKSVLDKYRNDENLIKSLPLT